MSLSIPDGQGGHLIKDISVTNSQPCYVTRFLYLNATYALELKAVIAGVSAQSS